MKNSALVLLIAMNIFAVIVSQPLDPDTSFSNFEKDFKKNYKLEEKSKREAAFKKNVQLINSINSDSKSTFKATVNVFSDWTPEQLQAYTKLIRPDNITKTPMPLKATGDPVVYPPIDYRTSGKVSPVKNQGQCGSCWAFSTAGMIQSLHLIESNTLYDLSQQFVLQCSGAGSCNGGSPQSSLSSALNTGLPSQTSYPYTANDTTASNCSITDLKKLTRVKSLNNYNNVTDLFLQQLITKNGPASVAISVNVPIFYSYSSGVYSACDSSVPINHAVVVVGWTAEGHWIVKNSWGLGWGQNGYITIDKNNNCNILQSVTSVALSPPPPSDAIFYTVELRDSYGDGWNANSIGFKQEGVIVSQFGSLFTTGKLYGNVSLPIRKGIVADVVVVTFGGYPQEVQFTIYDQNGNQVFKRLSGTAFTATTLFVTLCPSCALPPAPVPTTGKITITMTDSGKNGWQGNVLAVRQNGTLTTFGTNFTSGAQFSQLLNFTLKTNLTVDIIVSKVGTNPQQVGYTIKDESGTVLATRAAGKSFTLNQILNTFCFKCQTLAASNQQAQAQLVSSPGPQQTQNTLTQEDMRLQQNRKLDITIGILAAFVTILVIGLTISLILLYKLWQRMNKHNGQQIDMTRSHVTQSHFPEGCNPRTEDQTIMKPPIIN